MSGRPCHQAGTGRAAGGGLRQAPGRV